MAGTTQEFADAIETLLEDTNKRKELGILGKEHVREHFLTTRLLKDHLRLMNTLAADGNHGVDGTQAEETSAAR